MAVKNLIEPQYKDLKKIAPSLRILKRESYKFFIVLYLHAPQGQTPLSPHTKASFLIACPTIHPRREIKIPKNSLQLQVNNGTLCHALGWAVTLFSLQHFIAPALDLRPCLLAQGTRDCKQGRIRLEVDKSTLNYILGESHPAKSCIQLFQVSICLQQSDTMMSKQKKMMSKHVQCSDYFLPVQKDPVMNIFHK